MIKKQKLELTWVGKDNRPRLEPRILIEDPAKSYHAATRVSDADIFDNVLIHGDNLLALKALEADYAGKVKCVFIDPPYNTGSAFTHYDDGLEHSIWLGLIRGSPSTTMRHTTSKCCATRYLVGPTLSPMSFGKSPPGGKTTHTFQVLTITFLLLQKTCRFGDEPETSCHAAMPKSRDTRTLTMIPEGHGFRARIARLRAALRI
jgi:hypothetical protein